MLVCAGGQHPIAPTREGWTHAQPVKHKVADLLRLLLEDLEVLEHLLFDLDGVGVPDRVLAEEVERDLGRRLERDVFEAERAASDRVGLFLTLLVAVSEREPVDEVDRCRALPRHHLLVLQVRCVVATDAVDVLL